MNPDAEDTGTLAASVERTAGSSERALAIRFTGSGSEYFRIWIVNLLLTIVTLTLYRPWAKVRRLKYFYGNTLVDDSAFDFHGNPRKMLRGYLLVGAMAIAYSLAGRFSPFAALVAVLAVGVLWPALFRASMQFRLANTSWRGLRFRFSGDLAGAYIAMLPMFIPVIALAVMGTHVEDHKHPPAWYLPCLVAVMGFTALLLPLVWWNLKRYQHSHYGIGQMQTRFTLGPWPIYGVSLRVALLFVLAAIVLFFVVFIVGIGASGFAHLGGGRSHDGRGVSTAIFMAIGTVAWLLTLLVPVPYATSRLQNLVWSNTSADALRFDSHLQFRALLGVTAKNWLLMVLTLGLYWPFAAVATYRLRVESVTPQLCVDLERLHEAARSAAGDASGDAAGDMFGIDIGL